MQQYFKEIENKVKVAYAVAGEARSKGLDPASLVEIPLALNLAERVTGLISIKYPQVKGCGIENRIKELEKERGFLDYSICLQIAEEIAKEKFCKFQNLLEAIDAGIRVAFAYITLGVVSSPLEGYTHFKLKKTEKGEDYIAAYYSGPIRSAGGTGAAFSLLIIDHLREVMGYAQYDPTEEEVKRMITEMYDYHERIANLQYLPSEKELKFLLPFMPIQVDGDPSEEKEVSNHKDLKRIETNRIRNGPCLVYGEGLTQKAPKILKILKKLREKGYKLSGWDWFEKFVELQRNLISEKKEKATATYMQDVVAGRPIFSHPSRSGGFRLRYGRTRTTGYSAAAVSPATMVILNGFIAVGTQLKLEKPTKAAAITCCDSIDGPIVKLTDDSVVFVKNFEHAKEIKDRVKEIIYIGDMLITYGDFLNRNYPLMPPGYCEEWWAKELEKAGLQEKLDPRAVCFEEAASISTKFNIPLHPNYIFYWSQISIEQFSEILEWIEKARFEDKKLILPYSSKEKEQFRKAKEALEIIGAEHMVTLENVVLSQETTQALFANLGLDEKFSERVKDIKLEGNVLATVNSVSKFKIKDKAGTFIGARMGRPEKAKLRKLIGSPHVLFPVGEEGGRLRSFQESIEKGTIDSDFPIYFCEKCGKETIYFICEDCGSKTKNLCYCPECKRKVSETCPVHGGIAAGKLRNYMGQKIDISHYFNSAVKHLGIQKEEIPALVKGVRGTSSKDHIPENIAKGILRAQFNLNVNKDGTVRYDAIEVPITHFKPKEIKTSIEDLKNLGYGKDIGGKDLENSEQILELMPQDIILPSCPETLDEQAHEVFISVAKFIDNLLVRFYGQRPFYEVASKEDLVGHLVACIAPHNAAGVVGRIIGFSKTQGFFASPYMHAAMRRDCDGDEAAIMLLLDLLLNFSKSFLPQHRGGTQDAPLVLNARIRANEVDDMIFNVDVVREIPLELYEAAEAGKHPSAVKIEQIGDRLKEGDTATFKNLCYSHETSDINGGVICSAYKTLATMDEKVAKQMDLAERIRAVDMTDVARLIIERHFIRDIRGNLRKFSSQQFRCVKCNSKYRRPPLSGKCLACGGKIIFTIAEGSIIKYLKPAINLAEKYNVSPYVKQNLELTQRYIESIFGKEKEKQTALSGF